MDTKTDNKRISVEINSDSVSLKDIYNRLQENRKLEIKNLWQRSIFLATFLVLCYKGYGALVGKMIDNRCFTDCDPCEIDIIAIFISLIGIIMSILWIAMAKGSKAWQEVYEDAIGKIENELTIPLYCRSNSPQGDESKRDMCILSTKGGPYSPSKINIVIGQVSLVIWILIFVVHIVRQFNITIRVDELNCLTLMGIIVLVVIIWLILRDPHKKSNCFNIVSGHLPNKEEHGGRMPI